MLSKLVASRSTRVVLLVLVIALATAIALAMVIHHQATQPGAPDHGEAQVRSAQPSSTTSTHPQGEPVPSFRTIHQGSVE